MKTNEFGGKIHEPGGFDEYLYDKFVTHHEVLTLYRWVDIFKTFSWDVDYLGYTYNLN